MDTPERKKTSSENNSIFSSPDKMKLTLPGFSSAERRKKPNSLKITPTNVSENSDDDHSPDIRTQKPRRMPFRGSLFNSGDDDEAAGYDSSSPTKAELLPKAAQYSLSKSPVENDVDYSQKFQEGLEIFELWESRYEKIEKATVFLIVAYTVYTAQQTYFFSASDDASSSMDWSKYAEIALNTLPLLMTLVFRNYTLSKRMKTMRHLLSDYAKQGKEKTPVATYERMLKQAVQKIVEPMNLISTHELEQEFLAGFSEAVLTQEEQENLEKFTESFDAKFSLDAACSRWYHASVMFACFIFTAIIGLTILFCGYFFQEKEWQKIGQFGVSFLTGAITLFSTILDNPTLFPLMKQRQNLQDQIDIVVKMGGGSKRLIESFKDQLHAVGMLHVIANENLVVLDKEIDLESQMPLVVPSEGAKKRVVLPFFVDLVKKKGEKQKIFEQYEQKRHPIELEFERIKTTLRNKRETIVRFSPPNSTISKEIDFIISQENLEMTVDLGAIAATIDNICSLLNSAGVTNNQQMQTVVSMLNLSIFKFNIDLLQSDKIKYNDSPTGIVKLNR